MLSAAMVQEIITSPQNQFVQEVRALLNQPKARRKLQAFVAEGARLVEDGLRSGARARYVLVRAAHAPRVESALSPRPDNLPILYVEDRLFDSLISVRDGRATMSPHLGLGLYIVRLVAELHQGEASAANLPEASGVEFRLRLKGMP